MQIATAEALIQALRATRLFTPEQFQGVVRDVARFGNDVPAILKHLAARGPLSVYQLRKIVHGKGAELRVGPYVVTDKLGEGGMGRVYRARHDPTGREVALKVVRPSLVANPVIRGRFQREAEAAGTLRHPNIVRVEDAGEADGKYYLAMEFVDGLDLSRLQRQHRPLEIPEACEYARQAALGLNHAHEAGFVHRDIKPSNIVVSGERHVPQAREPAVVKILDMGLVREVGFGEAPDARGDLTRAGTVVGSPDYMAPEQAKNSSTVDHRADLYGLGCTLYFLLTGQPPFPDGTPIEKLIKHQLDTPLPLQALRRDVPAEVARVVAGLMAKRPADRYSTAADVADHLALLAVYPRGSRPVPVRARATGVPPAADDADVPLALEVTPVAASDRTPVPRGGAALHAPTTATPALGSLTDLPSGDQPSPRARNVKPPRVWPWAVAGALVLLAVAGLVVVLTRGDRKPSPDPAPPPSGEPVRPSTIRPPGILPRPNHARLHPHAALIPDGSGLVAVAYPSAFLRDKDTGFAKGAGAARLAAWANQLAADTALPLPRADRVVVTVPAASPGQFLLAAEGDFLTPQFGAALDAHPKLRALVPGKTDRPVRTYATTGGRQVALFSPPAGPVYALASGAGVADKLRPRLIGAKAAAPALDPGVLAALAPAAELSPPVLLAVAGGNLKVSAAAGTLRDYGLELLTLRVRVGERMELELTATGADEAAVREGLSHVAEQVREAYPAWGGAVADVLRADGTGTNADGKYRHTIRANWAPNEWAAVLDKLLAP